MATNYGFTAVIERDEDGYYASCLELDGCYSQGDTYDEALKNIQDAIRLHVEDILESGEKVPQSERTNGFPRFFEPRN